MSAYWLLLVVLDMWLKYAVFMDCLHFTVEKVVIAVVGVVVEEEEWEEEEEVVVKKNSHHF